MVFTEESFEVGCGLRIVRQAKESFAKFRSRQVQKDRLMNEFVFRVVFEHSMKFMFRHPVAGVCAGVTDDKQVHLFLVPLAVREHAIE